MRLLVRLLLGLDFLLTLALVWFFVDSGDPIYLFAAGFPLAAGLVFIGRAVV